MRQHDDDDDLRMEGRGRSAKKREAKQIEQLAQNLVELPETELSKLSMTAELSKEVETARNTKGHSSRKRQIKHLAGFLRRHEDERKALEAKLDGQAVVQRQETMAFQQFEELRDRLCDKTTFNDALTEVRTSYPHIDDRKLARLANAVHEHGDKKAAREIFRRLRKATDSP